MSPRSAVLFELSSVASLAVELTQTSRHPGEVSSGSPLLGPRQPSAAPAPINPTRCRPQLPAVDLNTNALFRYGRAARHGWTIGRHLSPLRPSYGYGWPPVPTRRQREAESHVAFPRRRAGESALRAGPRVLTARHTACADKLRRAWRRSFPTRGGSATSVLRRHSRSGSRRTTSPCAPSGACP